MADDRGEVQADVRGVPGAAARTQLLLAGQPGAQPVRDGPALVEEELSAWLAAEVCPVGRP
jgi:hypothetical protein